MNQIASLTGATAAEVQGTCSFYTMFKRRPCGKFVVSVCTNVSCLVTGGPDVLDELRTKFVDDPDVTVEEVECLAACGGAPALQVNYEFHENMTPERAVEIIDEYASGQRKARTISGARVG
jgi:NADH-quinone oxidoreductase subunit E